jgi:uroporphyrinogen decarboxylase
VDIVDPVQLRAMTVSAEELKQRFGGRLTFHGGLDTQGFLNSAAPEAAGREARRLIEILGRDGGYILSGSHFYQLDIPVENMEAVTAELARGVP